MLSASAVPPLGKTQRFSLTARSLSPALSCLVGPQWAGPGIVLQSRTKTQRIDTWDGSGARRMEGHQPRLPCHSPKMQFSNVFPACPNVNHIACCLPNAVLRVQNTEAYHGSHQCQSAGQTSWPKRFQPTTHCAKSLHGIKPNHLQNPPWVWTHWLNGAQISSHFGIESCFDKAITYLLLGHSTAWLFTVCRGLWRSYLRTCLIRLF